ncbi:right-handed parallel beta-helix repeat-containing protein [Methylobacterium radiodurans]|uniref:right-handed parallel beta-helix repeat-containing protein n=1 Tax=Methylobacterium radiodurans TaxID=2202828 RepID=UPI0013A57F0F|nr:right-handed parallel beta-helix repeat-containing protein [Methylobacterium radiodurans]
MSRRRLAGILAALAGVCAPVPAPAASDGAAGSEPSDCPAGAVRITPGDSIQRAALRAGPRGTVCLAAGLYRLQEVTPLADQTFLGEPGAVLDGARVLGGFTRAGPYWQADGLWPRGGGPGQCRSGTLCLQPLALFRDGTPLRRVAARTDLGPGRYLVEAAQGRVILADDPAGHVIEAASARFAFRGRAPNVRIRGLLVEKYDSPAQEGAIEGQGPGWRVERSELRYNSGAGVGVISGGAVRDCAIHHNGQLGATAGGTDILFENNRIFANNTAGFDPAWEAGGVKITASRAVVLRGNRVERNGGPGLWCDIDCRDVLFEGNHAEGNLGPGIFYEISYAAVIRRNTLRLNGDPAATWFWDADIQVAASEDVEVSDNDITVRPGGHAVVLVDQARARAQGGLYRTAGNRVHDNRFVFQGAGSAGGVSDAEPDSPNFRVIQTGRNGFDRNLYTFPAATPPRFIWGHDIIDFAQFRAAGQEQTGILKAAP